MPDSKLSRTDQRRAATFGLYQHELTGVSLDEALGKDSSAYTRALAHATLHHSDKLDEVIGEFAQGWTIDRIAPLERNILRVALLEMLFPEELPGHKPIPPEGAIDEAVETAKTFCSAEAPAFINGLLDAVLTSRVRGKQKR